MEGVSIDTWHLVAAHLTVRDLCRLMCVSKPWFYMWVADRAWIHQRNRVCARFPALCALFEQYKGKNSINDRTHRSARKRQAVEFTVPSAGIWYVFKKWILGDNNDIAFGKHKRILLMCMAELNAPAPMKVQRKEFYSSWYHGVGYDIIFHYPATRLLYYIRNNDGYPSASFNAVPFQEDQVCYGHLYGFLCLWYDFVLQRSCKYPKHNEEMAKMLKLIK